MRRQTSTSVYSWTRLDAFQHFLGDLVTMIWAKWVVDSR